MSTFKNCGLCQVLIKDRNDYEKHLKNSCERRFLIDSTFNFCENSFKIIKFTEKPNHCNDCCEFLGGDPSKFISKQKIKEKTKEIKVILFI